MAAGDSRDMEVVSVHPLLQKGHLESPREGVTLNMGTGSISLLGWHFGEQFHRKAVECSRRETFQSSVLLSSAGT